MKKSTASPILLLFCFLFLGCERDDICSDAFQVTPRLIIVFYDINEPDVEKEVINLSIIAVGEEDTLRIGSTNRIEIPLRTDQEFTRYQFIRQTDSDEFQNVDEINFTYAIRDVYVNRACGFKSEFVDFQAIRILEENTDNNWIRSLNVQQTLIDNDQEEPHLFIFH